MVPRRPSRQERLPASCPRRKATLSNAHALLPTCATPHSHTDAAASHGGDAPVALPRTSSQRVRDCLPVVRVRRRQAIRLRRAPPHLLQGCTNRVACLPTVLAECACPPSSTLDLTYARQPSATHKHTNASRARHSLSHSRSYFTLRVCVTCRRIAPSGGSSAHRERREKCRRVDLRHKGDPHVVAFPSSRGGRGRRRRHMTRYAHLPRVRSHTRQRTNPVGEREIERTHTHIHARHATT